MGNVVCDSNSISTELDIASGLLALRGRSNVAEVRAIASRSGLPLRWVTALPRSNGHADKQKQERGVLVLADRRSPFIQRFEHPKGRCYRFYKLSAYNNCNFWCEYCYLYQTFRIRPHSIHYVNYEDLFREMERFSRLRIPSQLRILNLGELGDPLAVDGITGFSRVVISKAAQLKTMSLLFLTKSDTVHNLLDLDHKGSAVISFSVNAATIVEKFEHRTPPSEARIRAARLVQEAGYETRFRIDPMFHFSGWKREYSELVNTIFDLTSPSMITIGEYRPSVGLAAHIRSRFPQSELFQINATLHKEDGKLRYRTAQRVEMFRHVVNEIRRRDRKVVIALCKEGPAVWRAAGIGLNGGGCNCLALP